MEKELKKCYFLIMKNKKHPNRTISVSFTKISEDVLVPTWQIETDKGNQFRKKHPFKSSAFIWWGLAGFWVISLALMGFDTSAFLISTPSVLIFAIGFFYVLNLPIGFWLEFNRKDGYVTSWKNPKKEKLFGREHIDNIFFQADRRWHSSGPKGLSSEYRYHIDLIYKNTVEKKTIFCTVFELFSDDKVLADPDWNDFFVSGAFAHRIDAFIRDFMKGKPLPLSSSSTYTFKPQK